MFGASLFQNPRQGGDAGAATVRSADHRTLHGRSRRYGRAGEAKRRNALLFPAADQPHARRTRGGREIRRRCAAHCGQDAQIQVQTNEQIWLNPGGEPDEQSFHDANAGCEEQSRQLRQTTVGVSPRPKLG
uniref:(northern house mosquito) hypothetical protein n=1 Tax=Culex pipiens TaxID=7175 RepID=A0A8D8B5D5_CULPI